MAYKSTRNKYLGTQIVAFSAPVLIAVSFLTKASIEVLTLLGIVSMMALISAYFLDVHLARKNLIENLQAKYKAVPAKRVADPTKTERIRMDVCKDKVRYEMLFEQDPETFEPYLTPNALDGEWLDEYGTLKKIKEERIDHSLAGRKNRGRAAGPGRVK